METPPPSGIASPRPRWNPTVKLVVSILLIVVLIAAVVSFRIVFIPLIVGAIIAYLMYPVVRRLRNSSRIPHGIATSILYLVLVALIVPIVIALSPLVVNAITYLRDELIVFANTLQTMSPEQTVNLLGFEIRIESLTDEISTVLRSVLSDIALSPFEIVFGVAETFLLVVFTFLIGYYLTRDTRQFMDWLSGLTPRGYQDDVVLLMGEINRIWAAFFRGQLILSLLVTVIITGFSAILGLPQPLLMGILAGMLEFLPSVGHTIWIITAVIIALLEGSTYLPVSNAIFALMVAGAHFAFTQFDLNVLIPRIIGEHVHLHPMIVIIGIIVGAAVGGVLGVALAAPTIATLRVFARYVYAMLFDYDPFPMIGPPSAPKAERLAILAQVQAARQAKPPVFSLQRLGLRRAAPSSDSLSSQEQ